MVFEYSPWEVPFFEETALPSGVLGPCERRPLRRDERMRRSDDIGFVPFPKRARSGALLIRWSLGAVLTKHNLKFKNWLEGIDGEADCGYAKIFS